MLLKTVLKQNKSGESSTSFALKLYFENACNFAEVKLVQCFVSSVDAYFQEIILACQKVFERKWGIKLGPFLIIGCLGSKAVKMV